MQDGIVLLKSYFAVHNPQMNAGLGKFSTVFMCLLRSDVCFLILNLPEKLKSVIWLIFWEGRTEKDAARILGVSDRTVRNRLHEALKSLRTMLDSQGKTIDG